MKIRNNFLFFLMLMSIISCDKKRVFDQYKSVNNSWNKDSLVSFDLTELEKDKKYNFFLTLRSNNDYSFNNLFLIVSLELPNKKVLVDTLQYQMANPDGSLLGEGFSDTKESKLTYKSNFGIDQKGKYKVKIQQANRQTGNATGIKTLAGISEVGFRIESID